MSPHTPEVEATYHDSQSFWVRVSLFHLEYFAIPLYKNIEIG